MKHILLVGLGGMLGAISRYKLGGLILHQTENWRFPLGTFVINCLGCLAIGLAAGILEERQVLEPQFSIFFITGFLGSFTTFSAFSFETFYLIKQGDLLNAALSISLNVAVCLLAVWLGIKAGRIYTPEFL